MRTFQYTQYKKMNASLINFLCEKYKYHGREKWIELIEVGQVKINHKKTQVTYILKNQDLISYDRPQEDEPKIDPTYNILYETDELFVIEKSGNLPISESGKYFYNTLVNILKKERKTQDIYPVHRIDRETSGLIMIAKSAKSAQAYGALFASNKIKKKYYAIVQGEFLDNSILVEQPLMQNPKNAIRIKQSVDQNGKKASTLFKKIWSHKNASALDIALFTGRTHQIRCHAEFIHFPILGDKLYGQTDESFLELIQNKKEPIFPPFGIISRQLLHASFIEFEDPYTNKKSEFYSDHFPFFNEFYNTLAFREEIKLNRKN